jgi:hypothetical protein
MHTVEETMIIVRLAHNLSGRQLHRFRVFPSLDMIQSERARPFVIAGNTGRRKSEKLETQL